MFTVMVRRVRGTADAGTTNPAAPWGFHRLSPDAARHVVRRPASRAGDLVVDLGAGHGVLTAALVDAGAHVVAVELHPARLASCAIGSPPSRSRSCAPTSATCASPATVPGRRQPTVGRRRVDPRQPAARPGTRARRPRAAALARPPLGRRSPPRRGRHVAARRVVLPRAPTGSAVAVLRPRRPPAVTGTVRAVPVDPPRLFVYGTLQPGRLRWPFLEPFAGGHRPADVVGRAVRLGLRLAGGHVPRAAPRDVPGHARRPPPRPRRRGAGGARRGRGDGHRPARADRRHDDRRHAGVGVPLRDARAAAWRASTAGTSTDER